MYYCLRTNEYVMLKMGPVACMADRPEKAYLLKSALLGNYGQVASHAGQIVFERTFFPEWATSHTKSDTNGYLGTLDFWGTKIAVQRPSDRFKIGCPHSTDSELCGHTRHVNQFHHVISQLCPKIGPLISRCFLKVNKIGLSDSIFVEYRKTL